MRESLLDQLPLTPAAIDHEHAREIGTVSELLDQLPEAVRRVHEDLSWRGGRRVDPTKGRHGMAAERVLRAAMLKQMLGESYAQLAFLLADSNTYRAFCRLGVGQEAPKRSTLQKNIKRVKPDTWEAISRMVVLKAQEVGVENGKKLRADCTVVESNIHHPTDSSLLWDSVRVLVRLMERAQEEFGIGFHDHSLRARRRAFGINNARQDSVRKGLYCDLLKVADKTVRQAQSVLQKLEQVEPGDMRQLGLITALTEALRDYTGLANRVISQTERRVLRGETVPSSEKIVSIFETHTDIIAKDRRDTCYGHKICLSSGASGMVTDVVVEQGNPADSTLAVKMVERHRSIFGRLPRQTSFDGGFASRANLADIKRLGVEDVAFNKRCALQIEDMVKSSWVYRQLCNFRAGIEAGISFLKRCFGLNRCLWRGFQSFQAYVHASVLACNLLLLARHVLAKAQPKTA